MPTFHPEVFTERTAQSLVIDYNNGLITQVKVTGTEAYGYFHYFISADNGAHWQEVQNGVLTTLTYSGIALMWRIEGSGRLIKLVISDYH